MRSLVSMLKAADDMAERVLFDVVLPRWRWSALVLAGLAVGWTASHRAHPPVKPVHPAVVLTAAQQPLDAKLLFRRPWIDRRPEDYKDKFSLYFFSDEEIQDGMFLGVTLNGIPVKYVQELNGFKVSGNKVGFWFPADDSKAQTAFKLTREKNGNFDLKLELTSDPRFGGKAHTYFGRMDGQLDVPGVQVPAHLRSMLK